MIAVIFLRDATDLQAVFAPFGGDDCATAVGACFFEAGRFGDHKSAKRVDHLRQRWLKEFFDFLRNNESGHCANMLTMRRGMGNEAKRKSTEDRARPTERQAGNQGILHLGTRYASVVGAWSHIIASLPGKSGRRRT